MKSVLILSLSSVFGLVFASLLLQEKITSQQIIAIAIMIAGIYLISIESKEDSTKVTGIEKMKTRNYRIALLELELFVFRYFSAIGILYKIYLFLKVSVWT